MFKALLICTVVSACAAGCAGSPQQRGDAQAAKVASSTANPCALPSASRIPKPTDQCSATPGRAYSQDDIERTGQQNVGDALQMLDPSITVHH